MAKVSRQRTRFGVRSCDRKTFPRHEGRRRGAGRVASNGGPSYSGLPSKGTPQAEAARERGIYFTLRKLRKFFLGGPFATKARPRRAQPAAVVDQLKGRRPRPLGRLSTRRSPPHALRRAGLFGSNGLNAGPFIVGEFTLHDSNLHLGSLNHDPAACLDSERT
jgi:hypothetical protein